MAALACSASARLSSTLCWSIGNSSKPKCPLQIFKFDFFATNRHRTWFAHSTSPASLAGAKRAERAPTRQVHEIQGQGWRNSGANSQRRGRRPAAPTEQKEELAPPVPAEDEGDDAQADEAEADTDNDWRSKRLGPWTSFRPVLRALPLDVTLAAEQPAAPVGPLRRATQTLLRRRLLETLDGARPERSQELLVLMHSLDVQPSASGVLGLVLTLPADRALALFDREVAPLLRASLPPADMRAVAAAWGQVFLLHNLARQGRWSDLQGRLPAADDAQLRLAEPYGALLVEALLGLNRVSLAERYSQQLLPHAGPHGWRLHQSLAAAAARNNDFAAATTHLDALASSAAGGGAWAQRSHWATLETTLLAALRLHKLPEAVRLAQQARQLAATLRGQGVAAQAGPLVAQTLALAMRLGAVQETAASLLQSQPTLEDVDALLSVLRRERVTSGYVERTVLPWLSPLVQRPVRELLERFQSGTGAMLQQPHAGRAMDD